MFNEEGDVELSHNSAHFPQNKNEPGAEGTGKSEEQPENENEKAGLAGGVPEATTRFAHEPERGSHKEEEARSDRKGSNEEYTKADLTDQTPKVATRLAQPKEEAAHLGYGKVKDRCAREGEGHLGHGKVKIPFTLTTALEEREALGELSTTKGVVNKEEVMQQLEHSHKEVAAWPLTSKGRGRSWFW